MSTKRLYLLIVEDEASHAEAIRRAFEEAAVDVETCVTSSLREARACVAERTPDLALLDLNLPDGRGLEVLTYSAEDAPFPVLIMTAFGSPQTAVEAMKGGVLDYIVKSPEAFATMPHTVERALREWELLQRHKQSETALRKSEEEFRSLAEAMPQIVWATRKDGWNIYFNQQWVDYTGLTLEESYGHGWNIPFHPDDQQRAMVAWQNATSTGGIYSLECRLRRADGAYRWWLARGVPLFDKRTGEILKWFGTCTDIEDIKRAEAYRAIGLEALATLNEPGTAEDTIQRVIAVLKTRTGFDAVGIRLQNGDDFPYIAQQGFSTDFLLTENTLVERGADGGVCRDKDGNVRLECTCGLVISGKTDPSHPLFTRGGSFWTNDSAPLLDLPPDQDPRHRPRNQCMHHGYASMALVPIRDRDKIVGLIHLNDRRKGRFTLDAVELLEGVAAHIGAALMRKQAEEARARSHELLANLARMVPGVVYQYRLYPDGRSAFPYSSPGMYGIYEVTPEEVREDATPVFGRLHPDDHERVAATIHESARNLLEFYCEFRVILPSQGLRWRWSQAHPERMDDGGTLWHGIILDITERRLATETSAALESKLRQAQKMESVGQLAGGVAHDFNNLLMGIMNYVELCRDELPPEHPARGYLDEIAADAQRSVDITKQLLAFARKQVIAPKLLDVNDALAGMLKMLRHLMGEDIALSWMPGTHLWPIKIDPGQLDQVLANLCVNARDAIAGVGRVTIETANTTLDETYCSTHAEAAPGEYVRLAVSDSGCGMSKDVLAHIFEPFFTTKEVGKGTGLGLATVYGIVEQNAGQVNVYSEPGKGTTFTIYLPRAASDSGTGSVVVTPERLPRGSETILLAEDEKSIRVTIQRFLEPLGYTVLAAETPEEAMRLAGVHSGPVHLLITDVIMPGMNGPDLAAFLAEEYPNLKCLFMSGYTADVMRHRGTLNEGMAFLSKPFSRYDLARKVREVLDGD